MDELKNRAHALMNAWTTGEVGALADIVAPQFEEIDRPQAAALGLDGLREKLALFHEVHAQVTLNVRKQVADGDLVCTQWTISATLRTPDDPTAPQPQRVAMSGMSWAHFAEGRIIRHLVYRDIVGYLMQRGYQWSPAPPKAAARPKVLPAALPGAQTDARP